MSLHGSIQILFFPHPLHIEPLAQLSSVCWRVFGVETLTSFLASSASTGPPGKQCVLLERCTGSVQAEHRATVRPFLHVCLFPFTNVHAAFKPSDTCPYWCYSDIIAVEKMTRSDFNLWTQLAAFSKASLWNCLVCFAAARHGSGFPTFLRKLDVHLPMRRFVHLN